MMINNEILVEDGKDHFTIHRDFQLSMTTMMTDMIIAVTTMIMIILGANLTTDPEVTRRAGDQDPEHKEENSPPHKHHRKP